MRDGLVSVSSWLLSTISSALRLFFHLSRPLPLPPLLTTRPSLSAWASHPSTCPLPFVAAVGSRYKAILLHFPPGRCKEPFLSSFPGNDCPHDCTRNTGLHIIPLISP
jgi:hypothetical protein